MTAAGIDLGGTKIEAQVFDAGWQVTARRRIDTPRDYDGLVAALSDQIRWCEGEGGAGLPIGIGAAGLINPRTGLALAANLPVTDRPFPADVAGRAGRGITFVNDCRAFTLSEAIFGAARGLSPACGVILGTGTGGGVVVDGRLVNGLSAVGGEFGHAFAPANLIVEHGLPVLPCGCGRTGCFETLVSGTGLSRLTEAMLGRAMTPPELVAARGTDPAAQRAWQVWCALVAEMLMTLVCTVDPEVIVLGGGLSLIPGLTDDLTAALQTAQLRGFSVPRLVLAQGGDASGARGAAYAAWLEEAA